MEDLARIVAIMFGAWIASGLALAALAWLAPIAWNRALRLTAMAIAAAAFVFLTGALFGATIGAAAALPAALVVYLGYRRGWPLRRVSGARRKPRELTELSRSSTLVE